MIGKEITHLKRFIEWLRWLGWYSPSCTCGQGKICTVKIRIIGNGQAEQDSGMLLRCGKVRRMIEQARGL